MASVRRSISTNFRRNRRKVSNGKTEILKQRNGSQGGFIEVESTIANGCIIKPEWTAFIANYAIGECASNEGVSIQYNGLASKIFIHHYGHAHKPNKLNKLRE